MGRNYIGSYKQNDLFEARAAGPLDARYVVENYDDLINSSTWPTNGTNLYIYEGMQVYVLEEQRVYILVDADNYNTPEAWKELASDVDASSIKIIDNLNSDDDASALSARQGKVLDNKIRTFRQELFDENDKINSNLLPSFDTGLVYGGTIDESGVCTLTSKLKEILGLDKETTQKHITSLNVKDCSDVYFIASEAGESIKVNTDVTVPTRSAGDWIISDGTNWNLIASNAVTSVVGKTGAITREQLLDALAYDEDKDAENTAEGGFIRKNEINRLDARIEGLVETTGKIGLKVNNIESTLTWTTL